MAQAGDTTALTVIGWLLALSLLTLNVVQAIHRHRKGKRNRAEQKAYQEAWHGPHKPMWMATSLQDAMQGIKIRCWESHDGSAGMEITDLHGTPCQTTPPHEAQPHTTDTVERTGKSESD